MKKSEAVNIIKELLDKNDPELIIKKLEELGFLPPPRLFTYDQYRIIETYNATPYTSIHTWDQE
jgi:hypothetical protein